MKLSQNKYIRGILLFLRVVGLPLIGGFLIGMFFEYLILPFLLLPMFITFLVGGLKNGANANELKTYTHVRF